MCLPKLESKISDVSTSVTTLPTQPLAPLKKDNLAEQLKKCYSELVAKDYSEDILQHICSKSSTSLGFLEPHAITPTLRSKMVDWMIEVLSSYKMSEETFFKSVKLMDQYLKKSSRRQ